MYFKSVEVEGVGPISNFLNIEFKFDVDGKPLPTVLIGENGCGKSIVLSHLVNFSVIAKQEHFDDTEVEKGKVYKYRSPQYVSTDSHYSFSRVTLTSGGCIYEWQLRETRLDFEKRLGFSPIRKEWMQIPEKEASHFASNLSANKQDHEAFSKEQCCLYFPVNRYEEPAWLNYDNLTAKARYSERKNIAGISNRNVICTSPLKANQDWLLDLIFDRQAFDLKTQQLPGNGAPSIFLGFEGKSARLYAAILEVLQVIFRQRGKALRFGVGHRGNRTISVMREERVSAPRTPSCVPHKAASFKQSMP